MKKTLIALLCAGAAWQPVGAVMDPARYNEISQLFASGHMDEGVTQAEKEIRKDKKEAVWYWLLDDIYRQAGEDSLRLVTLNRALSVKGLSAYDETRMRKARALFDLGRYGEADTLLASLRQVRPVLNARAKCAFADSMRRHPLVFERRCLNDSVNTCWDNLWPSVSADGGTLTTTVVVGKKGWASDLREVQEDLYVSHRKPDGAWTSARPLAYPINTGENEGACSLSADGRYVFFVACNRPESHGSCDIYYAIRQGDGWSAPVHPGAPLNTRAWESTPFLAASGKELLFSSNREGGTGGQDLWKCAVAIDRNGTLVFGKAENMGDSINTLFDEISPFLHSDGQTLYFSSNGWPGMGCSDIFVSRRKDDGGWSRPRNLGYPINTHRDEVGFVLAATGDKAYLSAISDSCPPHRRIYEISVPETLRPHPMTAATGRVADFVTGEALQARVEVFDTRTGDILFTTFSDPTDGHFTAVFPQETSAGFNVSRPGYLPHSRRCDENGNGRDHLIALRPIATEAGFTLENLYFGFNSAQLDESSSRMELGKLLRLMRDNPGLTIEIGGHTDSVGDETYNQSLSLRRAQAVAEYLRGKGVEPTRMRCLGYGASRPVADNGTEEGRARNRRIEFTVKSVK